jgi:ABC-type dipeptide/oligopeptide/nickel transport system permease component
MSKSLVQLAVTYVLVTLLTFALSRVAPGDPYVADTPSDNAQLDDWRRLHHSNDYLAWLSASVRLDFGRSYFDQRLVRERIVTSLAPTAIIAGLALLFTFGIGVPLGMRLATHPGPWARVVDNGLFVLHGIPVFWGGLILGLAAVSLGLPTHGALTLAVPALVYPGLARVARYQRAATARALGAPEVLLARAKGLPERRVREYIWRASVNAPLGLIASEIPWLIGGSVVVERIFAIHGVGTLTFDAIMKRDVPVIMGVTSLMAIVAVTSSMLTDIVQALSDPRLRT